MFPHERSLVERYQARPFVLLGVNADATREKLRLAQEKESLNWRNWWDGSGGPIASHWGVEGLPAVYLLDHRGVIRYDSLGAPDPAVLDGQIEQLVQEAEAEGRATKAE